MTTSTNQLSLPDSFVLEEWINIPVLELLCKNLSPLWDYIKSKPGGIDETNLYLDKIVEFKTFVTILTNLLKSKQNSFQVNYKHARNSNFGRLFASSPSLQTLTVNIRHTICRQDNLKPMYYDLDFKNCHPVILFNLLNTLQFKVEGKVYNYIEDYIYRREEVLALIAKEENISIGSSKIILLALLNGGKRNLEFKSTYLINFRTYHLKFLHDFFNEIANQPSSIYNLFYRKAKTSRNNINREGTCLNLYLCHEEARLLKNMMDYGIRKNVEFSTRCFDGAQCYVDSMPDLKGFLEDYNRILQDTEPGHILTEKPMTEYIDLSIFEDREDVEMTPERMLIHEALMGDISICRDLVVNYLKRDVKHDGNILYLYNSKINLWVPRDQGGLLETCTLILKSIFTDYLEDFVPKSEDEIATMKKYKMNFDNLKKYVFLNQLTTMVFNKFKNIGIDSNDHSFVLENFDRMKGLLPINGGCMDLKTCQFIRRKREHYFTFEISNTKFLGDDYDRDFCINYFKSLLYNHENQLECSEELLNNLILVSGYIFTGETNIKKFFNILGDGDNGKSLYMSVLKKMLGSEFSKPGGKKIFFKTKTESTHTSELYAIRKSRLCYVSEVDKDAFYNEEMIKKISGGDDHEVRNCGSNITLNIRMNCALMILTNTPGKFSTEPAFLNRLCFFDFSNKFGENADYADMLMSKSNDIFTFLCHELKKGYYDNNRKIVFCDEVTIANKRVADSINTVVEFLENGIEYIIDDSYNSTSKEIYDEYKHFCKGKIKWDDILLSKDFMTEFEKITKLKFRRKAITTPEGEIKRKHGYGFKFKVLS